MAKMWIEYDSTSDGENGSARWGSVTDEQLDTVIGFARKLCGEPDTQT
jgi:hypothetical protein